MSLGIFRATRKYSHDRHAGDGPVAEPRQALVDAGATHDRAHLGGFYPVILATFGFVFVQAGRRKIPWRVAVPFAIWPHYRWVAFAQGPYSLWFSISTVLQLSITWMSGYHGGVNVAQARPPHHARDYNSAMSTRHSRPARSRRRTARRSSRGQSVRTCFQGLRNTRGLERACTTLVQGFGACRQPLKSGKNIAKTQDWSSGTGFHVGRNSGFPGGIS